MKREASNVKHHSRLEIARLRAVQAQVSSQKNAPRNDRFGIAVAPFVSFVFLFVSVFLSSCAPEVVQHNTTGNEHFEAGEYAQAVAEYRQAQVDAPDQAEPYYNAANAYNRQAQLDAVVAQAQQALKTADPALAAQAWYNLGNAYFDAQQWPDAIAAYQEALRLTPDDQDAKHNLELALQTLEEQQQQEQEQEGQGDQKEGEQGEEKDKGEEDQKGEQEQNQGGEEDATPTPARESEGSEEQEQEATPEPSEQEQVTGEGEMTPQQALQLLQALMSESETLQERLQQIYRAPGAPPEEDW